MTAVPEPAAGHADTPHLLILDELIAGAGTREGRLRRFWLPQAVAFVSQFTADYGEYAYLADVFRQIGHDERVHKQESEAQLAQARFR